MKSAVIISTRFIPSSDENLCGSCGKVASHILEIYADPHLTKYALEDIGTETALSILERTTIEQQLHDGPRVYERYAACLTCYVQLLLKSTNDNFNLVSDLINQPESIVLFFRLQDVKQWFYAFAPKDWTIEQVYRNLTEDDSGDRLFG